ncbi:MAG: sugar-binding transcriptional regulator [Granulosicoccus sp.]
MQYAGNDIAREEEHFLVRIAWACEIEGLTQADVATRFGVTRLRVNKALAEARRRGIVRVSINSDYAACAEAEHELREKFALQDVHIAPVSDQNSSEKELIGFHLGQYLNKLLADPKIKSFGLGWGTTLNRAMRHMHPMHRPDLEMVSVMGCVTRASDVNIIESTRLLANLCQAQKSYFTAPLYASSRKSRNSLLRQEVFKEMLDRIRAVDALAMTVGDVSGLSDMIRDGLPSSVTPQELVAAGAVGDVLGYYLDEKGKLVKHEINSCIVGMELADLGNIPTTVLAAGGDHKYAIINAILKLGLVNVLVTDQSTAHTLINKF